MELHDWLILLVISALVVYATGRLLIRAWWSAKRMHQRDFIRNLYTKDEPS